MPLRRRFTACVFSLAAIVILAGCAIVDQYSDRAIGYNLEAEEALDQGLLLNIIRASQRRPMQFTSVQSITGSASASGTAGLISIPIGPHPIYNTGSVAGTVSGGPNFIVPVLDTQEFYQGVMRPIPGLLIDFFINEEYPREELFTLFVEKIVMHRGACPDTDHTSDCELVFVNYPGVDLQFDLTQAMIEYLLNLGITTEALPGQSKSSSGGSSGSGGSSASAGSSGSSGSSASGASASGSSPSEQSQNPSYRFCFAPRDAHYAQLIKNPSGLCGFKKPKKKSDEQKTTTTITDRSITIDHDTGLITHEHGKTTSTTPASGGDSTAQEIQKATSVAGFVLSDKFIDELTYIADSDKNSFMPPGPNRDYPNRDYNEFKNHINAFRATNKVPVRDKNGLIVSQKDNLVTLSIYTRSTEGILYFLGEVVRHELYPDVRIQPGQQHRILQIKIEKTSYRQYPERPCNLLGQGYDDSYVCEYLFVLNIQPSLTTAAASVSYQGTRYWVPNDPIEAGKTMHVLSIVKQLLAVNTSAKSLPQSSVISIISP